MNFSGKIFKNRQWLKKCRYHFGKDSATDWLVIVGVFIFLSAIFVGMAFYQFANYQKNDKVSNRTAVTISTVPLLDQAKLDSVVKYLTANEQKFKELKAAPLRFVDPSK